MGGVKMFRLLFFVVFFHYCTITSTKVWMNNEPDFFFLYIDEKRNLQMEETLLKYS